MATSTVSKGAVEGLMVSFYGGEMPLWKVKVWEARWRWGSAMVIWSWWFRSFLQWWSCDMWKCFTGCRGV